MRGKVPSLRLISLQREAHVIEVSDSARVPQDWTPRPGKKGVKRYVSPELQKLAEARDDAEQARQEALSGILQVRREVACVEIKKSGRGRCCVETLRLGEWAREKRSGRWRERVCDVRDATVRCCARIAH